MSRKEKLLARLQARPKDFTWEEACTLMKHCGYRLRSSKGSGRMFIHATTHLKVRLHQPHPENTLKPYILSELINALKDAGVIEQ
jgi:predicted RNA binding protein YcfA (HicA-like mRNA interferase family)